MKKNTLIFGALSGLIVSINMVIMAFTCNDHHQSYEGSMIIGFASMIIAFAFIFVGIKNYRDKFNGGTISFGKAFQIGALIAFIASTIYVLVWLFVFYNFLPNFMENYSNQMIASAKLEKHSGAELTAAIAKINADRESYKNPIVVILYTYMEILPIGIFIALIAALIMKRKQVKLAN